MSVLLEMAKALSRIDNKIDRFYEDVVPIIAEATRDARAIQFDKNLMTELIRECKHPDRSVIREANIKYATGQAKQLYARGDRHPNVVAVHDANQMLPEIGSTDMLEKAKRDFINSKMKAPEGVGVAHHLAQSVNKKLAEVEGVIRKGLKVAGEVSNMRVEIESSIGDTVARFLEQKFEDLESREVGQLTALKDRIKSMEFDVKEYHKNVVHQQKLLEEKSQKIEDSVRAYEAQMQSYLHNVSEDIDKRYSDISRRIEMHEATREADKQEMLSALFDKQRVFFEETSKMVEAESAEITKKIEEGVEKLNASRDELNALADKTKDTIIAVDKTKAQLGNLIPQPRRRIRNQNG